MQLRFVPIIRYVPLPSASEFGYTQTPRAIGATVSAGALHAQGWGFESLIAHHLISYGPCKGTVSCLGPLQRDSNPKGLMVSKARERLCHHESQGGRTPAAAGGHSRSERPTSLIAHHLISYGPCKGIVSFLSSLRRNSNPEGAELRKRTEHLPAKRGRHHKTSAAGASAMPEHVQWRFRASFLPKNRPCRRLDLECPTIRALREDVTCENADTEDAVSSRSGFQSPTRPIFRQFCAHEQPHRRLTRF